MTNKCKISQQEALQTVLKREIENLRIFQEKNCVNNLNTHEAVEFIFSLSSMNCLFLIALLLYLYVNPQII